MKILAIDTTTKFFCLGFYDGKSTSVVNLDLGRRHSQLGLVTIERALEYLDLKISEIDYFVCGLGPGSFTGIRVGMALVKGFAWALDKPVIGLPSLDILALNALVDRGSLIMPAVDAKRGLIYTCIYQKEQGGLKKISPYLLLDLDDFLRRIKQGSFILGDALQIYKERITSSGKRPQLLDRDYWYPRGEHLIGLALARLKGQKYTDASRLKPIYLYPKECQIKKKIKK